MTAVLMFNGCGNSNSAESPIGADSSMTENESDELFSIEGKVLEVNETNILINESGSKYPQIATVCTGRYPIEEK